MLCRRSFVSGSLSLIAANNSPAAGAAPRFVDLTYRAGQLTWPGGVATAVCGRGGVRTDKREGDGASPAGTFPLTQVFYRADRLALPATGLPIRAMQQNDGWVDEPTDPQYNRLVALPYPGHHEEMWRDDGLYDLVVVIGYNTDPPVAGRGSAIFLHCARPDFSPTVGCIAIARDVIAALLAELGPGSTISILP